MGSPLEFLNSLWSRQRFSGYDVPDDPGGSLLAIMFLTKPSILSLDQYSMAWGVFVTYSTTTQSSFWDILRK